MPTKSPVQSVSSRNLASEDSVIFKSVLDYNPIVNEYTILPRECNSDKVEFTIGGVSIATKEDKKALQRSLTAGYRPKEGISVIRLQRTGVDQVRIMIKSGMAVVLFTVISLLAYTYLIDLSALTHLQRYAVVLSPLFIGAFGMFLAYGSTVPLNKEPERPLTTTKVSSDVVIRYRRELFQLKRRFGSSDEQDYLFSLTAYMDQASKQENWEVFEKLKRTYESRIAFYRDKVNKSSYSISTINMVGGVGYRQ